MNPAPDEFAQTIEGPWVAAPASSHLKEFRLVNRAFAGDGRPSELFVVFRQKVTKTKVYPESEYRYESTDHTALATTFEAMGMASEPGKILNADLIGKGNRGTKVR